MASKHTSPLLGGLVSLSVLSRLPNVRAYTHDDSETLFKSTRPIHGILLGVLECQEGPLVEVRLRGQLVFRDANGGQLPCRLLRWSPGWLNRPLAITQWRYVPTRHHEARGWYDLLEISQVATWSDKLSAQALYQYLEAKRLEMKYLIPLSIETPLKSLDKADMKCLTEPSQIQSWLEHTTEHPSSSQPISIVGRVKEKSIIYRQPGVPSWFMLRLACPGQYGMVDVSILFCDIPAVYYDGQIQVNDWIWFNGLEIHTMNDIKPCPYKDRRMLYFTTGTTLHHLSMNALLQLDFYKQELNRSLSPVDDSDENYIHYKGIVIDIIDNVMGIYELRSKDNVDTSPSDHVQQRTFLYCTHDLSYRLHASLRLGYTITLYNVHVFKRKATKHDLKATILYTCASTSIQVNDFGKNIDTRSIVKSIELQRLYRWCDCRVWGFPDVEQLIRLSITMQTKFPDAFSAEDLLRTSFGLPNLIQYLEEDRHELDRENDCGMIWHLVHRLGKFSSHPYQPLETSTAFARTRNYLDASLEHSSQSCRAMISAMREINIPELGIIYEHVQQWCTRHMPPTSNTGRCLWWSLAPSEIRPKHAILVGVIQGGEDGQLEIADATGQLSLLVCDEHGHVCTSMVHMFQLGHIWAITHYEIAVEGYIPAYQTPDTDHLRYYVRFSWKDAICLCQAASPLTLAFDQLTLDDKSSNYASVCVLLEHLYPLDRSTHYAVPSKYIAYADVIIVGHREGRSLANTRAILSDPTSIVGRGYLCIKGRVGMSQYPGFWPGRLYLLQRVLVTPAVEDAKPTNTDASWYIETTEHTIIESIVLEDTSLAHDHSIETDHERHLYRALFHTDTELYTRDLWQRPITPQIVRPDKKMQQHLILGIRQLCLPVLLSTHQIRQQDATAEPPHSIADKYHSQLVDFSGIVLRQQYIGPETDASSRSAHEQAIEDSLAVDVVDQLSDQTNKVRLYITLGRLGQRLPAGIAHGERVVVRRAARLQQRGPSTLVALACTSVALDKRSVAQPPPPPPPPPSPMAPPVITRLDMLFDKPDAYKSPVWIMAELMYISEASIWWNCASCGQILEDDICTNGCPKRSRRPPCLDGHASCRISDGSQSAYLRLAGGDLVLDLLQAGVEMRTQLRKCALKQGRLVFQRKQGLEATYGPDHIRELDEQLEQTWTVADTEEPIAPISDAILTAEQLFFYRCCQKATQSNARMLIYCHLIHSTWSSQLHPDRLAHRAPVQDLYLQRQCRIRQQTITTLTRPHLSLQALSLTWYSARKMAQHLLEQFNTTQ